MNPRSKIRNEKSIEHQLTSEKNKKLKKNKNEINPRSRITWKLI